MATIRCASCGRLIQESDRKCLYCNAENTKYKASSLDAKYGGQSYDYGNSYGSYGGSYGGSYSTPYVSNSSYSTPSVTDTPSFEKQYKAPAVEPVSTRKEDFCSDAAAYKEPVEVKPPVVKKDTTPNFSNAVKYAPVANPPRPEPKKTADGKFSFGFEPATRDLDTVVDTPAPVDYKAKLDAYRKENGYGEYSGNNGNEPRSSSIRRTTLEAVPGAYETRQHNPAGSINSAYTTPNEFTAKTNSSINRPQNNTPYFPPAPKTYTPPKKRNNSGGKIIIYVIVYIILKFIMNS